MVASLMESRGNQSSLIPGDGEHPQVHRIINNIHVIVNTEPKSWASLNELAKPDTLVCLFPATSNALHTRRCVPLISFQRAKFQAAGCSNHQAWVQYLVKLHRLFLFPPPPQFIFLERETESWLLIVPCDGREFHRSLWTFRTPSRSFSLLQLAHCHNL